MIKKFNEYIIESKSETLLHNCAYPVYFDKEKMEDYLLWFEDIYGASMDYDNQYMIEGGDDICNMEVCIKWEGLKKLSDELSKIDNQIKLLTNRVKVDYGDDTEISVSMPHGDVEYLYIFIEIRINNPEPSADAYEV